jgi:hypothetical protein
MVPAPHKVQTDTPAALVDPAAQDVQVASDVAPVADEIFPAAHDEHALFPIPITYLPEVHEGHEDVPVEGWAFPDSHNVHAEAPPVEYVPAEHCSEHPFVKVCE